MITEQNFNKLIQDIINPETREQAWQEYGKQKLQVTQYIIENEPEPSDHEDVLELPTGVEVRPNDQISILHNGERKVATYVGVKYQPKTDTIGHVAYMDKQPYWVCDYKGVDHSSRMRLTWEHCDTGVLAEVAV